MVVQLSVIQIFGVHTWLFYFMLGGLLSGVKVKFPAYGIVIIVSLLLFNVCYEELVNPLIVNEGSEFFYSSLPVMLLVISIFLYVQGCDIKNPKVGLISNQF